MPRTVKPKMAIPGTVLLQAGESRSFSSVQWGLLAAASFMTVRNEAAKSQQSRLGYHLPS